MSGIIKNVRFAQVYLLVKGTVNVISSDRTVKDVKALYTTVPLKPLPDQEYGRCCCFSRFRNNQFSKL